MLAENDPSLRMGTTIVILLIKGKIYCCVETQSLLFSDNTLYRLTKDHSFVQKLVDAGQIDENEAENHQERMTNKSSWNIRYSTSRSHSKSYSHKDKFLLCSDGLCGLVNDPTLANALKNTSLGETVNDLISLLRMRSW